MGKQARLVALFVIATFVASWALWAGAAAAGLGGWGFIGGTVMPAVVALGLTAWRDGSAAAAALAAQAARWRAGVGWYALALFFMAAVKLAAAGLQRLIIGTWPTFGDTALVLVLLGVLISTPVQAGEEIGWRGFMTPRLAALVGWRGAGLITGVVWATWHLPMFFIAGGDMVGQSFPVFALSVTAIALVMTAIYVGTRSSLLLTMLMHSAVNNTTGIVPSRAPAAGVFTLASSPMGWLTAAVLWGAAAGFLVWMPKVKAAPR